MTRMQQTTCDRYWLRASVGDRVIHKADPVHVGRIERIQRSTRARIRWDSGLISDDFPLHTLWPVRAQNWIS
jgi:hypothetical protein